MTVKASFLVVRKPVDDLDEYYQPVTVVLESTSPKPLEILQKVVVNAGATCKYMKEVMAIKKRAEDSFLAFRLRREPSEAVPGEVEEHAKTQPPSKALRQHRAKQETSTLSRDPRGSVSTPPVMSRPRVKTIKKVGIMLLSVKLKLMVLYRRFAENSPSTTQNRHLLQLQQR
jgi:hypothetical protein